MAARSRFRTGLVLVSAAALGCGTEVKPKVDRPAVKPVAIPPSPPPAEKAKAAEPPKKAEEPAKKVEPPKKQEFKAGEREVG